MTDDSAICHTIIAPYHTGECGGMAGGWEGADSGKGGATQEKVVLWVSRLFRLENWGRGGQGLRFDIQLMRSKISLWVILHSRAQCRINTLADCNHDNEHDRTRRSS